MSLEKFYYRRNDEEMKKIGENDSCTIKKDIYKVNLATIPGRA